MRIYFRKCGGRVALQGYSCRAACGSLRSYPLFRTGRLSWERQPAVGSRQDAAMGDLMCPKQVARDRDQLTSHHTASKLHCTCRARSHQIGNSSSFSLATFVSGHCWVPNLSSHITHSLFGDDSQRSKCIFCDERLRTTGRYSSQRAKDQHDTRVTRYTITEIHAWNRDLDESQRPSPSVVLFAIPTTNVPNSSYYELLQSAPITTCTATFTSSGPGGRHVEP